MSSDKYLNETGHEACFTFDNRRARERLDLLLLEGFDSGNPIPATPEFWKTLKRDALAKLNSSHTPRKGRSRKAKK